MNFMRVVSLCAVFCCAASSHAEWIIDGASLVQLTNDGKCKAIAWAWHGDMVAFVRQISNTQGQLMVMRSDGSGQQAISPIGSPFCAEWSWKSDKIAYAFSNSTESQSQAGIFVYDLKTKKTLSVSAPYPRSHIDADDGPFWSADDRHVVYKVYVGPAKRRQVWIGDTVKGKNWRLLPDRGDAEDPHWSPAEPGRIALLIQSSGDGYDVATTDMDGRNFRLLTDIDAQSVTNDQPRWSQDGKYVAFKSDMDMTRTEHEMGVEDCRLSRPDGSEARNLTRATTASTEDMLNLGTLAWTWDNEWLISRGVRYDQQGNAIGALYRINPRNGGYEVLMTSQPRQTGQIEFIRSCRNSCDGTKLAYVVKRQTVRNWGPEPEYENTKWVLGLYDLRRKQAFDLLVFDEQLDRKEIQANDSRYIIEDISWSPDSRSILLTIAAIISEEDKITQPDVYRLDLPPRFVDASASQCDGPPMGRGGQHALLSGLAPVVDTAEDVDTQKPANLPAGKKLSGSNLEFYVTEVIQPQHMTVDEAVGSLMGEYGEFFTVNASRNIILFKGPPRVLAELKSDLRLIDTLPPHILVDLLAVELSEEANRDLGLDWTYSEGHFAIFAPGGNAIRDLTPDPGLGGITTFPGVGQAFYQGVGTLPREFFARLSLLVRDGEGTILANPRTVATSGVESSINIRKTLNYFFNEGFDVAGRPVVKKSDISSDTIGRITPTLLPDGRIHLVVDVKVGTFTFTQDAGLPELTTRESATEVTVEQGETIVIGGLRQQEKSHTVTKVPLLGDLPLLGFLFKHQETRIRHNVLTIFITPQVLCSDNLRPDWLQLDPREHRIVPIMKDEGDETY
ncbi:MAG: hypothetical protein IH624_02730 [Phycisphaerae bacterium]|nr:hypothetical protein [Phycisphaerae bacterium]